MKLELLIAPLAILLISGAFLVLGKRAPHDLFAIHEQTKINAPDTLMTGAYYLFQDSILSTEMGEEELKWSYQFEGEEYPHFDQAPPQNIYKHKFNQAGKVSVRAYSNRKLVAMDSFEVVAGFDGIDHNIGERYPSDLPQTFIQTTQGVENITWRIVPEDSTLIAPKSYVDADTLQLNLTVPGDYTVYIEASNKDDVVVNEEVRFTVFDRQKKEEIDTDGDGKFDFEDVYPNDPKEWANSDGDRRGDNSDAFPYDPSEWLDTDRDGIGNRADTDDDNDGILDAADYYPTDKRRWEKPIVKQKDTPPPPPPSGGGDPPVEEIEACFGEDLGGLDRSPAGVLAPAEAPKESGVTKIRVTPLKDIALESFDFWSNPGVGTGSQRCLLTIECLECAGKREGKFTKKFSTPHEDRETVEYRPKRKILLKGKTYVLKIETLDEAKLGFIPVGENKVFRVEDVVELEYLTEKTCVFDMIFKN